MPLIKTMETGNGLLLLWKLTEDLDVLKQKLPASDIGPDFQKLTHPRRQKEWLTVRILLQETGCRPDMLTYSATGQPQLKHEEFKNISISHSDKLAGMALHKKRAVGLDIENSTRNFIRVEKKYLSADEIKLARTIPDGHGLFWCIKEAVYKAGGTPGIRFPDQIRIHVPEKNSFSARLIADNIRIYQIRHFKIDDQIIVYLTEEERNDI